MNLPDPTNTVRLVRHESEADHAHDNPLIPTSVAIGQRENLDP